MKGLKVVAVMLTLCAVPSACANADPQAGKS
jgi:hypothetical protein